MEHVVASVVVVVVVVGCGGGGGGGGAAAAGDGAGWSATPVGYAFMAFVWSTRCWWRPCRYLMFGLCVSERFHFIMLEY